MIKLAAEKNLNKFAFPVMSIKGKPVQHPCTTSFGSYHFGCTQGVLTPRHWMILDIVGTYTIHQLYTSDQLGSVDLSKKIPTPSTPTVKRGSGAYASYHILREVTKNIGESTSGFIDEQLSEEGSIPEKRGEQYSRAKKILSISFTDQDIKRQLPFLKKYSSLQISQFVRETSNLKLLMNYPIRYYNGKDYRNFPFTNYEVASSFFSLQQVTSDSISATGAILSRRYTISFNTILGYLYVQNCLSCYTDLLPGKFYTLSDYAQLFYRILVLPYFGGLKDNLSLEEISRRLVLRTKDTYMVRKTIRRILTELADTGFLKTWEEKNRGRSAYYHVKKSQWKELTALPQNVSF